MNKIFNEQYELLLKDMEEITDPYHRAHIRALVLQAVNSLTDISEDDVEVAITGKDAIKEDIAKDTKKTTTETTKKKTTTASKKKEKEVERNAKRVRAREAKKRNFCTQAKKCAKHHLNILQPYGVIHLVSISGAHKFA